MTRLMQALIAVGMTSLLGCSVSLSELQARNPVAATLHVHCRPSQIPDNVKVMAVQSESGHIVTDEDQDELLEFARLAGVFIEFDESARAENAGLMASEYGLVCPNMEEERPSESLRDKEPCAARAHAADDSQYMGNTNRQPCESSAGNSPNTAAGARPASLPRIGVCARPEGISSNEWYGGRGIKADAKDQAAYDAEVAKATVIFHLDPNAPPESIWHFGPNVKARCPGKAPIAYDQWVAKNAGTGSQQTGSTNGGTSSTTAATPPTPKKGDEKKTETSAPGGKGPPLSFFERIANNMAVGAALVQGDTSRNLKDPNGHRNGMVTGTNVGGWSFPPLQAGLSAIQIITSVGLSPKTFVAKIAAATKGGQRLIINEADKAALKMADELIQEAGQYELAKGFQEISAVLPFNLGQKFTKNLESKFQAHKIFEKQAFEHYRNVFGKQGLDEAIAKSPSVILTEVEHQAITNRLNDFWREAKKEGKKVSQKELRAHYQKVYKDHPHWLQAMEHLLRQVP